MKLSQSKIAALTEPTRFLGQVDLRPRVRQDKSQLGIRKYRGVVYGI